MLKREMVSFGIWTAAGFGLCVAIFGPQRLTATDVPQPAAVTAPTLVSNDVELSVKLAQELTGKPVKLIKVGAFPELKFEARNQGKGMRVVAVIVTVYVSPAVSPMARTMPAYRSAWTKHELVQLPAGESEMLTLKPEVQLKHGENVTVTIATGKEESSITPLRMSVEPDPKAFVALSAPATQPAGF